MAFESKVEVELKKHREYFDWLDDWTFGFYKLRKKSHGTAQITIPKEIADNFEAGQKFKVGVIGGKPDDLMRLNQMIDYREFDGKKVILCIPKLEAKT